MDKDRIVDTIKEWIKIENDLKEIQKIVREKREEKKLLTHELCEIMKNNEIDCFDTNGGKIMYTKNKVKTSLSKKHLLSSLFEMFKDDPHYAEKIATHILDSREDKVKESIRHKNYN